MRHSGVLVLLMALPTIGCDAASVEAIVNAAHHGTRVDGQLPNLGDPEQPRVFTNDMGWTITLAEGFVVTAAAQLEDCEGTPVDVSLPFGPFPEYWVEQDKNVTDFGYVDLPAGTYCKLILEYGRYRSDVAATATDVPFPVRRAEIVEGRTLYLLGSATKPDGMGGEIGQSFVLESDETVRVTLDMSQLSASGGPFSISGDEVSPPNLTVLKAYDALFTGVDFANLDVAAYNASVPERLIANTSIILGTSVF